MNEMIETLKRRIEKLEAAPPREHPALAEPERVAIARKLAALREARIGEARKLREATEAAFVVADTAIKAARRKLSDVEDVEILAERKFAADEAGLRTQLRRGRPDCIAEFLVRLADEARMTREEGFRNGVVRVNQAERIQEDQRLALRRAAIGAALEAVEGFAELAETEAQLRTRFEALLASLGPLQLVHVVEPTRITPRPDPDPKTVAEALARTFQTNPRSVSWGG